MNNINNLHINNSNNSEINEKKDINDHDQIVESCVFCKIAQSKIDSVKVYENDYVIAFMDIYPNVRGHVLIIPKSHYENIYSIPGEDLCHVIIATQKIAIAIKNSLDADGVNIIMNNESAASQVIWHAHFHIIPRYNDDGGYIDKKYTYILDEMKDVANKIAKEL